MNAQRSMLAIADELQTADELDLTGGDICDRAIKALREAAQEIASLRAGLHGAVFYLERGIRKDVKATNLPDVSKYDDHYRNALADMRAAWTLLPECVGSSVSQVLSRATPSVFLSNLHYFFAQTDGTYKYPPGAVGDLLRQAKREIEAHLGISK